MTVTSTELLRDIAAFYFRRPARFVMLVLFSSVGSAALFASPSLAAKFFEAGSLNVREWSAHIEQFMPMLWFLVAAASWAACGSARMFVAQITNEEYVAHLRAQVLRSFLLNSDLHIVRSETVTARLIQDAAVLRGYLDLSVDPLLVGAVQLVLALVLMLTTSVVLTLTLMVSLLLVIPCFIRAEARIGSLSRQANETVAAMAEFAQEVVTGVETVRAFNQTEAEIQKFGQLQNACLKRSSTLQRYQLTARSIVFAGIAGVVVITVGTGLILVSNHIITNTDLLIFLSFGVFATTAFIAVTDAINGFAGATGAYLGISKAITAMPVASQYTKVDSHPAKLPTIKFDAVSFRYPNCQSTDRDVLNDINFTFDPRDILAIVGPSGAGKSTLLNLLTGRYSPTHGRIHVGATIVDPDDLVQLRDLFARVSANTFLFSRSVRENVSYGMPAADDLQIQRALDDSLAGEFVAVLPQAVHSTLSGQGRILSTGQRQRLGIARACLSERPYLVLDEATSALDSVAEAEISERLIKRRRDRGIVIVSHRLSSIRMASKILVLSDGRIAESGTHEELVAANGVYFKLFEKQLSATQEGRVLDCARIDRSASACA